ncbi:type II toxin-antitoxin system HicA family toxin [Patescibacteria group bacterium]|nr:type II toxin-antitoxin system HicA family toxin [Patescibacteria group bacterium]MBU4274321.1 type II toxin-antitoxin system HicA family toxin [Patescibacteria group bacterium]MBU4367571.1 type II toxin-antitoxin system HicA family toxin [Patescibacteria group bacterium]MBU4461612.1 type II toxin-antitoxin system HicA family toxin [Patescibacteria group bacterium]MCG2699509.1 type II toxin-antitoxin system HicA family toxin [Candidatus Parcubacteria bacterium]
MPKGVFNWNFSSVVDFLKKHGFTYTHAKGSHYYYTGHYNHQPRIVQVPLHGSKSFKPRTFKGIVKQSGIPLKIWLE